MAEHGRLIDADALYEKTAEWEAQALHMVEVTMNDEDKTEWRRWNVILTERSAFKFDIADAPTIEPERKKGKWIECETSDHWKCEQCGECAPIYLNGENMSYAEWLSDFCPNCGADMRNPE